MTSQGLEVAVGEMYRRACRAMGALLAMREEPPVTALAAAVHTRHEPTEFVIAASIGEVVEAVSRVCDAVRGVEPGRTPAAKLGALPEFGAEAASIARLWECLSRRFGIVGEEDVNDGPTRLRVVYRVNESDPRGGLRVNMERELVFPMCSRVEIDRHTACDLVVTLVAAGRSLLERASQRAA